MSPITKKRKRPTPIKWLKKWVKGFDETELERLKKRHPNIDKIIRVRFGKISSYNRHYTNSVREIERHTKLRDKYHKKIKDMEKSYMNMIKYVDPKITLCRPTKDGKYPYWRGKVWWGVSVYGKKSGWVRFHIISDKKVKKLNLSEDDIKELGKEKFVKNMVSKDLEPISV